MNLWVKRVETLEPLHNKFIFGNIWLIAVVKAAEMSPALG